MQLGASQLGPAVNADGDSGIKTRPSKKYKTRQDLVDENVQLKNENVELKKRFEELKRKYDALKEERSG